VERARDICKFRGWPAVLTEEILSLAWRGYFGTDAPVDAQYPCSPGGAGFQTGDNPRRRCRTDGQSAPPFRKLLVEDANNDRRNFGPNGFLPLRRVALLVLEFDSALTRRGHRALRGSSRAGILSAIVLGS
jgi:hypothetical protein